VLFTFFFASGQINIKILNIMGTDVSSLGGKTVGAWRWQLPPSSRGVKSDCKYAFTEPVCLHVIRRDYCTFLV